MGGGGGKPITTTTALSQLVLRGTDSAAYEITVSNTGALLTQGTLLPSADNPLLNGGYELSIATNGALMTTSSTSAGPFSVLTILAPNGTRYRVSLSSVGALLTAAL